MMRRNAFTFILLVLMINFIFGVYLLGQRHGISARSDYYRAVSHFGNILEMIRENHVNRDKASDYETLTQEAINGMLRALDPHSDLLITSRFEELQSQTRQEYGGIGIHIERRNERITIVAPIANTPGEKAGFMPGDQIISVDGQSTETMNLGDIVGLLRGEPRSRVAITIHRPRTGETVEKEVVREIIQVESVRNVKMLDNEIGHVQITQFGERTADEFVAALNQLEREGMRALVLDLRNNPGGLLNASVYVAEPFFRRGELIVYTEGRDAHQRHDIRAGRNAGGRDYPIAVLINSGSASASEIVAGALQDTRRAVVVGETSFGKGSVQSILPLRDGGALRLTTAHYYTPGGRVIHERGIVPDIVIELPIEEEVKLRVQRNRPERLPPEEFMVRFGFKPIADRQLDAAVASLRGLLIHEAQRDKAASLLVAEAKE